MILYGAVILVILLIENEAKSYRKSSTAVNQKPGRSVDTGVLARLIHHINEADAEDKSEVDKKFIVPNGNPLGIDLEYIERTSNEYSEASLVAEILKKYEEMKAMPGGGNQMRLHLIKNPYVLERFKEKLLRKGHSTSSSSDDDSSDYDDLRSEKFVRRNAIFRLGKISGSSEHIYMRQNPKFAIRDAEDSISTKHMKYSREDDRDRKNHNRNDKVKDQIIVTFKDKPDEYDEIKKRFDNNRHKENNEVAKKEWDIITSKTTDDWDISKKKDYNDEHKNTDDWDTSKKKDYNDEHKKTDDWDISKKKDYNDEHKQSDRDSYDKWYDKETSKSKKNTKRDDWNTKRDDSWDNWKSKSMEKAQALRKQKRAKEDDWGKPKRDTEEDWDKPKRDTEEDWDKPKNKDVIESAERTTKIDWQEKEETSEDSFKLTTNKNDWIRGWSNKASYAPKIDYYPRPRHDSLDHGGFKAFGRTSIPFVGKKGIYEDK